MNVLQVLSRAFRNRFVELHFDEIPSSELVEMLQQRCELPPSYSELIVKTMLELQVSPVWHCLFQRLQFHVCVIYLLYNTIIHNIVFVCCKYAIICRQVISLCGWKAKVICENFFVNIVRI